MSELEKTKNLIIQSIQKLCAHCMSGNHEHNCPVKTLQDQIKSIHGVPLIVNDEFRGVIFR